MKMPIARDKNATEKKEPLSIFGYLDYRTFLKDACEDKILNHGQSYRGLAKRCKINAPNYLQQVISGKRPLSVEVANKIADGFGLKGFSKKYLVCLAKLDVTNVTSEKVQLLEQLKQLTVKSLRIELDCPEIYSSWLNGLISELAVTKNFILTAENVHTSLGGLATRSDIAEAIEFLVRNGFLVPTPVSGVYERANVYVMPINDVRNFDLRKNHLQFLELAKLRLSDPLDEREYQGLTVAVPVSQMPHLKQRLRQFIQEIRDELEGQADPDEVIRIQCSIFRVTR